MSWQSALILHENERYIASWKGKLGFPGIEPGFRKKGVLVLTNQRLIWLEQKGLFKPSYSIKFDMNLDGISEVSAIVDYLEVIFYGKEVEFYLDANLELCEQTILRYKAEYELERKGLEKEEPLIIKEKVVTKEIVMIPCPYCGALRPQTALFCPNCGASLKSR